MSERDYDFKYSHKRESEIIEGRQQIGAGAVIVVVSIVAILLPVPIRYFGIMGAIIGAILIIVGKIRVWAAEGSGSPPRPSSQSSQLAPSPPRSSHARSISSSPPASQHQVSAQPSASPPQAEVVMWDEVVSIIAKKLGVDKAIVTPTASLLADLGAGGPEMCELMVAFEGRYVRNLPGLIPDEEWDRLQTVGELFDYLKQKTKSK